MASSGDRPFPTSGASLDPALDQTPDFPSARPNEPTSNRMGAPSASTSGPGSGSGAAAAGKPDPGDTFGGVVQGAHDTIDKMASSVEPHVRRLQEGLSARAEHVKELGDEWTESLRTTVRENPLVAVATAALVGMLVARLTQR